MKAKTLLSIFILVFISVLIIRSMNYLIQDATYEIYENDCRTVYHGTSDRNIILRVDDIQTHYLKDIQIRIIQDALIRNKTLSLAVIPFNLFDDKEIIRFLKENKCRLEIGLHGYDHSDYEFAELSYSQAEEKIKNGLEILKEIEPDIITFIPPNNELSEGTKEALFADDIKIISSGFQNREFGFSVSTYDWKKHEFADSDKIIAECRSELDRKETCIIMIHPQDYATNEKLDPEKYKDYIRLLEKIDELNATVVTFRDLYYKNVIRLN